MGDGKTKTLNEICEAGAESVVEIIAPFLGITLFEDGVRIPMLKEDIPYEEKKYFRDLVVSQMKINPKMKEVPIPSDEELEKQEFYYNVSLAKLQSNEFCLIPVLNAILADGSTTPPEMFGLSRTNLLIRISLAQLRHQKADN